MKKINVKEAIKLSIDKIKKNKIEKVKEQSMRSGRINNIFINDEMMKNEIQNKSISKEEVNNLEIKNNVSADDKKILNRALNGITGWSFNPIAVICDEGKEYYYICKVKSIIKDLQMQCARVYVKILENQGPRILSIEEIN